MYFCLSSRCRRKFSDKITNFWFCKNDFNKTRTSKVGAISKAQKAQNIFFFQKKSHSAEKSLLVPSGFINIHSVAKYQKTRRGDPLGTFKKF